MGAMYLWPKQPLALCCVRKKGEEIESFAVRIPARLRHYVAEDKNPFDPDGPRWLVLKDPADHLSHVVEKGDVVGLSAAALSLAPSVCEVIGY